MFGCSYFGQIKLANGYKYGGETLKKSLQL